MKITPIIGENLSVKSGATTEYEVWRRWEDCLWFQDTLELEYAIMSRDKRQALAEGKGVKRTDALTGHSVYVRSDEAASFESLPPGPDPSTIATDIHDYVPRLTKKGTFFRASQATVDQRHREFKALIEALFVDDLPSLLRELRATRTFRDFFGFWRRDHDLALKTGKAQKARQRGSVASSAFSLYFSQSMTNLHTPSFSTAPPVPPLPTTPRTSPPERRGTVPTPLELRSPGAAEVADAWRSKQAPVSAPPGTSFTVPVESDRSSSSEASSMTSSSSKASATASNSPQINYYHHLPSAKEQFGDTGYHNSEPIVIPQDISMVYPRDQGDHSDPTRLPALPEGRPYDAHIADLSLVEARMRSLNAASDDHSLPPPRRRGTSSAAADHRANRNGLIFLDPPGSSSVTGFGHVIPDEYVYASSSRGDAGSARGSSRRASQESKASRLSDLTGSMEAPSPSDQKYRRLSATASAHRLSSPPSVVDDGQSRRASSRISGVILPSRPISMGSSLAEIEPPPPARESVDLNSQLAKTVAAFGATGAGDLADRGSWRRASSPQFGQSIQHTLRRSLSAGSRRRSFSVNRPMFAHEEEFADADQDATDSLIDQYYYGAYDAYPIMASSLTTSQQMPHGLKTLSRQVRPALRYRKTTRYGSSPSSHFPRKPTHTSLRAQAPRSIAPPLRSRPPQPRTLSRSRPCWATRSLSCVAHATRRSATCARASLKSSSGRRASSCRTRSSSATRRTPRRGQRTCACAAGPAYQGGSARARRPCCTSPIRRS
jgi:hypothetical protein